jgi:hypothetical protein
MVKLTTSSINYFRLIFILIISILLLPWNQIVFVAAGQSSTTLDSEYASMVTGTEPENSFQIGSKNMQSNTQDSQAPTISADIAASSSLITCDASANNDWTTTADQFEVIQQCSFRIPGDGWVFINADASLGLFDTGDMIDDSYEAQFRIGIDDSLNGDPTTDRFVNIYEDGLTDDGTDKSIVLSVLKPITAGMHTFYFLGRQSQGTGMVLAFDPTLTVRFIPATNSTLLTCGVADGVDWATTSSTYEVVRQCTLSIPQNGFVYISADGSAGLLNNPYVAQFRIGIDESTTGQPDTDRWVNVSTDGFNGTDKSVGVSVLKPVTPGERTFYFLGRRSAETGTVRISDPTLTVIFFPQNSSEISACGASSDIGWTTTSSSLVVVMQCTLSVPRDGWVFIAANGSLGLQNSAYEAQFRVAIDESSVGDPATDRWVNIYSSSGLGTDETVGLSVLKPITAGEHTFYFLGQRFDGTGTVLVRDPTLTVLTIPAYKTFLPIILR